VVLAPLLFFLLASLFTYSSADPAWSRTGSVTGAIHNIGGPFGATIADLAFWLFGYAAYSVPLVLGGIAWIALFGLDTDGDGHVDFGPALRLIGIVGFLVSAAACCSCWVARHRTCRRNPAASSARSPAARRAAPSVTWRTWCCSWSSCCR
jgi:S-DNA-T family DNA segregation ATPase FtsK/SpoIIIE